MTVEQHPRSACVLAQDEVGLAKLGEHAERHVLQVPDRRRADDERHYPLCASSASKATRPAPTRPASTPRTASTIRTCVPRRGERPLGHDLPRRLKEKVARSREAAADHDDLRVEDVDVAGDALAEARPHPFDQRAGVPGPAAARSTARRASTPSPQRRHAPGRPPDARSRARARARPSRCRRRGLEMSSPRGSCPDRRPVDVQRQVPELSGAPTPPR